jgi:Foot protein 3.
MEEVLDKEREPEFYMEMTMNTRIVSILVSLILLGQGDTYGYKYKPPRRTGGHPQGDNQQDQHPTQST